MGSSNHYLRVPTTNSLGSRPAVYVDSFTALPWELSDVEMGMLKYWHKDRPMFNLYIYGIDYVAMGRQHDESWKRFPGFDGVTVFAEIVAVGSTLFSLIFRVTMSL